VKAGRLNSLFSEIEGMLSEKLLRLKEVAQLLIVTPQTLQNWSKYGFLKVKLSEVRRLLKPDSVSTKKALYLNSLPNFIPYGSGAKN